MYSEQFLKSLGLDPKIWNADSSFRDKQEYQSDKEPQMDSSTPDSIIDANSSCGDLPDFNELFDDNFGSF